jgi:hypothetical protein
VYEGGNVVEVQTGQGKPVVSWAGFDRSEVPMKVHRANARLIAAAPELLEATLAARRAFINLLEMGLMPSKEYDPDTQKLIDQMHEAIVKATGSAMPGR